MFGDLLRIRAETHGGSHAYSFLADGEKVEATLTFEDLDRRARAIAAWLEQRDLTGRTVLLFFPPGLEFITAFLGCLDAGAVAVPSYPPGSRRGLPRVRAIIADARPAAVLTAAETLVRYRAAVSEVEELADVPWLAVDALEDVDALTAQWQRPPLGENDLAFLQYTSGSTASPKGVMVTHGNLLHNEEMIRRAFGHSEASVIVSWLPLYHDMGLIGGVLQPLFVGASCYLMSPVAFLQRPLRWPAAVSRFRATTSGAPNFAYELCCQRVREDGLADLDLSSWQVAFNGAEPVRAETLERFERHFAPCGFAASALYPCYGLAEATLFVTGNPAGRPAATAALDAEALGQGRVAAAASGERSLVGCGEVWGGQEVAIVDPETLRRCPPERVGEVWIRGASVTRGYWNQPEATARDFAARIAGEEASYLRTGDLGFLHGGQLFVAGRLKDLIVLRGRNHYPQDLERTAEAAHPALRLDAGAAFAVDEGGQERLVLVLEVERPRGQDREVDWDEVIDAVRRAITEEHEVAAWAVVLVRALSVPKTSSGKVQRRACRQAFLDGELSVVAQSRLDAAPAWAAAAPEEVGILGEAADAKTRQARLLTWFETCLLRRLGGAIPWDPDRPLTALGLDSVGAIELANEVEAALGVAVDFGSLLAGASARDLAAQVLASLDAESPQRSLPVADRSRQGPLLPEGLLALSQGQRALWFLERVAPEGGAYHIVAPLRILRAPPAERLRQAFQALVDHHPALRTSFVETVGGPRQRIETAVVVDFAEQQLPAADRQELDRFLHAEAYRPFDLDRPPLLRLRLVRGAEETVLLLVVHHLVADFWSLALLARRLAEELAETTSEPVAPAQAAWDLAAHLQREQERLGGAAGERLWRFWQGRLEGRLPELQLPADRPRPPVQTYEGASRSRLLSAAEAAPLHALAQRRGATLYTVALAAFYGLLHHHAGQRDLVVGTPTAGRRSPQLAQQVGYFVNPLPLRWRLRPEAGFGDLVTALQAEVAAALAHQDYPFALLVDRLQPLRDASRPPLFQVLFVLQSPPAAGARDLGGFALQREGFELELGPLAVASRPLTRRRVAFDLSLILSPLPGGGLGLCLEYNTDLFDAVTAERLLRHYDRLLRAGAGRPEGAVAELPWLSPAESQQLRVEWNEGRWQEAASGPETLHELVAAQARRTPDATALVAGEVRWSYRELAQRSARLAIHLRALGTAPEGRIGVLLERGPGLVVALLAILEAGGAYVPLDPAYPAERLVKILEDGRVERLLVCPQTRTGGLADVLAGVGVPWLELSEQGDVCAEAGPEPLAASRPARVHAEQLAYVIFTSGSTGRPKGVALTHRSAAALLCWARGAFGDSELRGVLAATSICFDLSVFEIFTPLAWGGVVVLAQDALQLPSLAAAGEVSLVNTVPSAMAQLLRMGGIPAGVRTICLAGEPLTGALAAAVHARPGRRLLNLYGPSEDTTYSTWSAVAAVHAGAGREPSIGRPVAGTTAYVVGRRGRPVAVGVVGELLLAGAGLARGYLGARRATAERFVPDGLGNAPGTRLYRTGDLARFRTDGELEFLGRADHQVKVRGFRIELGEVETALQALPEVSEAVVSVHEDAAGQRRLVAYVVAASRPAPTAGDLRAALGRSLPDYMVPARFVTLEALPRTPNGKLDRRALPAPDGPGGETVGLSSGYVAPRTETEATLAGLWSELLGVARVGIHDNFFELGGDSILGLQVVSRAAAAGLHLAPRQIFQQQTVAALAAVCVRPAEPAAEADVRPAGPVPLTPIQREFFAEHPAEPHHDNQAVALELLPAALELGAAFLQRALARLLEHHDALRLRFEVRDGQWRSSYGEADAAPAADAFAVVDLSALPAARCDLEAARLADGAQRGFDLGRGPLLRALLVVRERGQSPAAHLLLVAHHLGIDAVSWRVLVADLESLCREQALPVRTSSFKAWGEWLEQRAAAGAWNGEMTYWQLQAEPAFDPKSAEPGTVGESCRFTVHLSPDETAALLHELPAAYRCGVEEALLCAVVVAAGRRTGRRSLGVDLEAHGRDAADSGLDLSRTVGWFTSRFPLRLELASGEEAERPGEALRTVKQQLREVPGRGLGYGALRHLGSPEVAEVLAALTRPQISFNYLGRLDAGLAGSDFFALADRPVGQARSPLRRRRHRLELDAAIRDGRLEMVWTCPARAGQRGEAEALAAAVVEEVRRLAEHACQADAGGYVPADFPLAMLDRPALDRLLGRDREVEDLYPLSPMQAGLLFHHQLDEGSDAYVQQMVLTLVGQLDTAALERAWAEVIQRQPALRTAFLWQGLDRPLQQVRRRVDLAWRVEDWRGLPEDEAAARLEALLAEDRRQGFDPARAPLLRLARIRRDGDRHGDQHQLVWSHHHLILDGWSLPRVLEEVFEVYAAMREGRSPRLAPAPRYRDFIAHLAEDDAEAAATWRRYLEGCRAPTPVGIVREPGREGETKRRVPARRVPARRVTARRVLPAAEWSGLRAQARRWQVTPATLFQGAWALLLARMGGETDVLFGTTVAGRPPQLAGIETAVGLFINTVPVRVPVPLSGAEARLGSWLAALQQRQQAMAAVEQCPLVDIQGWSGHHHEVPLFETLLLVESYPLDPERLALPGLRLQEARLLERTHYPLTLAVLPGRELELTLAWDEERVESAAARRALAQVVTLLRAFAESPDAGLRDLPVMTSAERHQVLVEWNAHPGVSPSPEGEAIHGLIHDRFHRQAARTPDLPAVSGRGETWSYGRLARRSRAIARQLRRLGAAPGVLVGLCAERSPELVAALLGILEAGAAFVPLDPEYPAERLALMLEDSGVRLLVGEGRLLEGLPASGLPAVRLDSLEEDGLGDLEVEMPTGPAQQAQQLAYVIYTSGSTGRPKGVMVSHANVLSFFAGMDQALGTEAGVWLAVTSVSFDISVLELLWTLGHGFHVIVQENPAHLLPGAGAETSSPDLAARVAAQGVTHFQGTPSLAAMLSSEEAGLAALGSLRHLLLGGEALPANLAARLTMAGEAKVHNLYGPTETTVWSATCRVQRGGADVTIGRPIRATSVYVLDGALRPRPLGLEGELCIGGPGVVQGYLHRPALTAERFVPDSFGEKPGGRLYRTGDLVRHRPDGELEFLGRRDQQVKVRGVRVELGEIEHRLEQHPQVAQVVVVPRGRGEEMRLVAYTVPRQGLATPPTSHGLEAYLRRHLPPALVPAGFVFIEEFPLTPNRKVDRSALPDPAAAELESRDPREARSPTEEVLSQLWADLLEVPLPGPRSSFFALGGHSLLATQAVSRIREVFQVEMPLRRFFDDPTVEGVARQIEALRQHSEGLELPPLEAAVAGGGAGPPPLSFAQERIWFLDQLAPAGSVYNEHAAGRLEGSLDPRALALALAQVVRRHEVLRSRFSGGNPPRPEVEPRSGGELPVVDLTALTASRRPGLVQELGRRAIRRPFDLAAAPPRRFLLLRLSGQEHVLCLVVHHIAIDGWSWRVLFRELAAHYGALTHGVAADSALAAPALQYRDFARWQRAWLRGDALEAQMRYWRRQLSPPLPQLDLPTDRPRPAMQTSRGASHRFALPAGLEAAVRVLGTRYRVTPFMVYLAAFQSLLSRLSGQTDQLVGTPIANRNHRQLEDLIGVFVNTLVLRLDLGGRPGFGELLGRVREVCIDAYAHQDLPFEKLVAELQPERDLSRTPLLQAVFVMQNDVLEGIALPGLAVTSLDVDPGIAKFDLTLALWPVGGGLSGLLEYNLDLFDPTTIQRFEAAWLRLLEAAVAAPERPVAQLPLLSPAQRHALAVEWSGGWARFAAADTLVAAFERQVTAAPDSVAVRFLDQDLSYGQLDERAERLARELRRLGVGPEMAVGVHLERGLELVVAILAVLKAGGAYVPVDPAYPAERLAYVVEDARLAAVISQRQLVGVLASLLAGRQVPVVLAEEAEGAAFEAPTLPSQVASADSLAYVIYTSGSTGRPKGVMIHHRHVLRLLEATRGWFGFGPGDVWTLFHSTAFDFSVWELWGALTTGGRLVVVPFETSRSPEAFLDFLVEERVTVLNQTPSAFYGLIQAAESAPAGAVPDLALRHVVFGGEALELRALRPWVERFGDEAPWLVNMYGITETTVHVTWRRIHRRDVEAATGSVIGAPLPDLSLHAVDTLGQPVPLGVPGELVVGGAGPGRGYLHRPDLTAERFRPDPFSPHPGARLYHSGDLARWRPDGEVEYLGRRDHQVKVRGFRIELGEIEAALARRSELAQVVVTARREDAGGTTGTSRLAAYAVAAAGAEVETEVLRAYLRSCLPDYMVPAAFVILDELPRTPSGKVDRRALPAPVQTARSEAAFAAPAPGAETVLAEIWAEVLGVERVGAEDNFFALGGDSILLLQVVTRAREAGLVLTPRQVFEYQTVAELAAVAAPSTVQRAAAEEAAGSEGFDQPAPLTPIQHWFFERDLPRPDHYNQALLLEVTPPLDVSALRRSLEVLVERHGALRLRFARRDGSWWQQEVSPDEACRDLLQRVDLESLDPGTREVARRRLSAAAQAGLDLEAGPLFRALLLVDGENRPARLLLVAHHLVVDGVSWRVLVQELEVLYGRAGDDATLLEPPLSFSRWARALGERAAEAIGGDSEFWRHLVAEAPAAPSLPVDLTEGADDVGSQETVTFWLEGDETEALLHEVPQAYRTRIQEVLLAALALAARGWTGSRGLWVDVEGHGREEILPGLDLARTVGWFTAIYPVFLDPGPATDPGETLRRIKDAVRRCSDQAVSFGLWRYLRDDSGRGEGRRPASLPKADVLFNYWGQLDRLLPQDSRLRQAAEDPGPMIDPTNSRSHLLELGCRVIDGRFEMTWSFSGHRLFPETVERWADEYRQVLRSLIDHCRSAEAGATPSDFHLVNLGQRQLNRLMRKYSDGARRVEGAK